MSENRPDTGNYYPWLQKGADNQPMSMSFLSQQWPDVDSGAPRPAVRCRSYCATIPSLLSWHRGSCKAVNVMVSHGTSCFARTLSISAPNGLIRRRWRHRSSEDADRAILAFNRFAQTHEHVLAKYLFASGTTWPGVLFQGDRASLSSLLSRPEVDADRVGCMGLSIGGYRSAHLFALDPRLRTGVVSGWMPSYPRQMFDHFRHHTWMVCIPCTACTRRTQRSAMYTNAWVPLIDTGAAITTNHIR